MIEKYVRSDNCKRSLVAKWAEDDISEYTLSDFGRKILCWQIQGKIVEEIKRENANE